MITQQIKVSTSELARRFGKDRATVRRYLDHGGVKPVRSRPNLRSYELGAATAALSAGRSVNVDTGYHLARSQKTRAEAARILLKLQRERGQLAPVAELREAAQNLLRQMHERFNRYARDARGRLFKAKSTADLERILTADIALIFDDLKRDYPNI
jgi:hypothetical protein